MSLAAAPRLATPYAAADRTYNDNGSGAHSLLQVAAPPPNYPARVGAMLLYFALLGLVVTVGFKTQEQPIEEQQVIELAPVPDEEPPPEDTPPPPEALEMPDIPPPALDPIAPVEEQAKPVEKPKPKLEKPVEKPKPRIETRPAPSSAKHEAKPAKPAPRTAAPAVHAPPPPAGATISEAANHYHACLQRAAAGVETPFAGRVTYHATVSASGSVTSFSVTSSSNSALAGIAQRLGARCGSVPAPGHPGSLSGGISFSGS